MSLCSSTIKINTCATLIELVYRLAAQMCFATLGLEGISDLKNTVILNLN